MNCQCYSTTDNNGVIHPVLCAAHELDFKQREGAYSSITWKYKRYFNTEQDARDRVKIIQKQYPAAGYGTMIAVTKAGKWSLVRATWGSAD